MNRRNLLKLLVGIGAIGGAGGLIYESPRTREELSRLINRNSAKAPIKNKLVDVTAQAGIFFHHNTGAFGEKYLPETLGSGCAFLDYENDGWLDILLINGKDWGKKGI
ncbi:MAG: CRTAC1 family protein, partial [Acidobacteria bacterium]|nr:CRTAC1 family protein [Acidobacteriota bacterium]